MVRSRVSRTIIIGGSLAQKPGRGGLTWVFLQYILGFKRLGWDVLFLDRLEPAMCVDRSGQPCRFEESYNLDYFLDVMEAFGLQDAFSLTYDRGSEVVGLSRDEVADCVRTSALLLNVMGYITDEQIMGLAPKRVFLDIDPGFSQMWRTLGLHDAYAGYDAFVTIGENIGQPDCSIPSCGLPWITTPQPIVLDFWPAVAMDNLAAPAFTSVASWRGPYGPIEYYGTTYGLRVHEFRKFAALPRLTQQRFELALDIHAADAKDRALLTDSGWVLHNPYDAVGDPWRYREFIQRSSAEVLIAKSLYVQSQSGWVSDRSLCYLASGKPVLAQDTGLQRLLPTGEGLVTFSTLDEAAQGVEEIVSNYSKHALAARAVAEEYFDSDKVLGRLLQQLDD
jgi:glycosyltransferase involved in cell wall biosynthesis